MKIDFKKGGALAILVTIGIGLAQFASATLGEIHGRLNAAEQKIGVIDDDRSDIKDMLKEIRNDVKSILKGGR